MGKTAPHLFSEGLPITAKVVSLFVCPTEELGLFMSSLCKVNALLEGSGCGGEGNTRAQGQLTSSKEPERMGKSPP